MSLTPHQIIQQVKDDYNLVGEDFSRTRKKKIQAEFVPFIRQVKPGMRVLDVGCGSGRLLQELNRRKIKYLGIDFSESLIKQAKKEFPKHKFLLRNITDEKGWRGLGKFDAVFCLGVLHHIPDRKREHEVLRQMFLHTKPEGFVFISVWNLWQTRFIKYHLLQLIKKINFGNLSFIWVPYSGSDGKGPVNTVWRFCKAYLPGELLGLVRQVGYQIETFYYAKKGKTRLSIFKGENFCILGRKRI